MRPPGRFLGVFQGILRVLTLVWEGRRRGFLIWRYSEGSSAISKTMFSTLFGKFMVSESSQAAKDALKVPKDQKLELDSAFRSAVGMHHLQLPLS